MKNTSEIALSNFTNNVTKYFSQHATLIDDEIKDIKRHGFISYVTDCEGSLSKLNHSLERNDAIIAGLKKKHPELAEIKTQYVIGGDLTDKGRDNIAILKKVN